jgi:hypothetical protein
MVGDLDGARDESEACLLRDENAFGLLISWFDAEEVEYAQSADKFPPRVVVLRAAIADYAASFALGEAMIAFDFGTTFYFELSDGDQTEDLIGWMRSLRAFLEQGDWVTIGIVTHGGRWVPDAIAPPVSMGSVRVVAAHGPSEPMRRALAAESRAHDDEESGEEGWGTGLFVDADALEALGRKLKNAPTMLRAGGASFVRVSS